MTAQPARVPHQRQGAFYAVRNPPTLFAATMKTQALLYVVRDPSTLFTATMKTQGALYAVRDARDPRSN